MEAQKKPVPRTDNPKDFMMRVRMDKVSLAALDECVRALGTTRSDIVRRGIFAIRDGLKK